jgi:hypothetical protein
MPLKSHRWIVGVGMPILAAVRARAEDQIGFVHESYVEDHARMSVDTETVRVQKTISPWLDVVARGVYDGISGATPIGAPAINQLTLRQPQTHTPVPNAAITGFTRPLDGVSGASPVTQAISRSAVPLAQSHDIRRGYDFITGLTFGPNHLAPEFSYSKENDYVSYAGALNYSLDLNDKNTTVTAGWSHSYDHVLPNQFTYLTRRAVKNSDDVILGIVQLLGPRTVFSFNATFGHDAGYLNDPYRSVVFDETRLDANAQVVLAGEKRPSTRDSQAPFLSLTQAIPPLNASVEATYRFYHDSFGIVANTVGAAWFQKIGTVAVISPSFRYYRQTAARFYAIQFPGDPINDPAHVPRFYSSDYRLSSLETFTVGLQANIKLHEQWNLRLGYQRYWMRGLDHVTLQSTYPNANIFTIGIDFTF